jgi:DNA-binding response OmpR family regulator
MTILLVEDDVMLAAAIADGLRPRFQISVAHTIADAELAIATDAFELAILDVTLPDGSGLDLLKSLRRGGAELPVIMLTARTALGDRLAGLNGGADDYLGKPFDLDELIARCDALLRRSRGRAAPTITHGGLHYDASAQTVTLDDVPVPLSARELALFDILITNIGRILGKHQIEERLYSWNEMVESNTVEVHVSHLRRKIGRDMIQTVRGLGYVMPKLP